MIMIMIIVSLGLLKWTRFVFRSLKIKMDLGMTQIKSGFFKRRIYLKLVEFTCTIFS